MLKIPVGIDDYLSVKKDCFCVDKTLLIKEIEFLPDETALLITRPRRFGKSFALSMIQSFYELTDKDMTPFFADTKIWQTDVRKDAFSYPVIKLNFKDYKDYSFSKMREQIIEDIRDEYNRHHYLLDSPKLNDYEKNKFQSVLNDKDFLVERSIYGLSELLYKHHGRKVIILIDEYDTPIEYAFSHGEYDETIQFFRNFYSRSLKSNHYVRLAVLTGVLQISKESLFSGLNNVRVSSIFSSAYDEYFGFTEAEAASFLSYYGLQEQLADVKRWYDGYLFGNVTVYNPWSIVKFVEERRFDDFWVHTGENDLIKRLLNENDETTYQLLIDIFEGRKVIRNLDVTVNYNELKQNVNNLLLFFLLSGYLTIERNDASDFPNTYSLKIPNLEVADFFRTQVLNKFNIEDDDAYFSRLIIDLKTGKVDSLKEVIGKRVLPAFSSFEFSNEKNYQVMVLTLSALLLGSYLPYSELNSGLGRLDIALKAKNPNDYSYVFEIKVLKGKASKARLMDTSRAALRQIKEKEYAKILQREGVSRIYACGLAFNADNIELSYEKVD